MRMPPSSTPAAAPKPPTAPQTPSAMLRSRPSRKVVMRIERAAGEMIAAPRPCSARAPIRDASFHATPATSEPSANTTRPAMNIRRRPSRSASAAAEQQEAAEDERVGADHPLEVLLREAEVDLDRRQGDVHDRDVEDDHELHDAQDRERPPLAIIASAHLNALSRSRVSAYGSTVGRGFRGGATAARRGWCGLPHRVAPSRPSERGPRRPARSDLTRSARRSIRPRPPRSLSDPSGSLAARRHSRGGASSCSRLG